MSKPRKPTPKNSRGRFISKADAAYRDAEIAERKKDVAKLPKGVGRERFKNEAVALRKARGPMGRRDTAARTLAKANSLNVTHRTFYSADSARDYLANLPAKKSKLAWWGVSARDDAGNLFAYQNPVATVDRSAGELKIAQSGEMPVNGLRPTDYKVKESVRSADTRITVAVLNLKGASKNAPKLGNKTRSVKSQSDSRNGSGKKSQSSRKRR